MIGQTLGHYRVLEKIGAGGMGVVYRARDERLDRDVALKVLPPGVLADESARKRFRKEALALSHLSHPHIATIYDFDSQDGSDFLVMEYLPGGTLADRLTGGALPEKDVATLGAQIASALDEAHEKGVVHRDLKPGNIAVTPKGQAKVLDFGLARVLQPEPGEFGPTASLTDSHAAVGTWPYMAPEQLRGERADARTDIYAFGVVLYEMAAGQRPFREESSPRLTEAILHQPPVSPRALNPRMSAELERIILKCLEKDPENRYQAAKEVGVDLRRLTSGSVVSTVPVTRARPLTRRAVVLVAVAVVTALVVVVAGNVGGLRDRLLGKGPGRIESIAVLPLANLSGDPEQEYFADGMTEALIADLAQISALRVISRTSVTQYKNARKPLPQIAKELNVDAVVEGSVQRSGNRVRVTAQLIHAATDRHLWARTYERDFGDILTLQSEVARAIADEIRVQLTPREQAQLAGSRPVNPEALEATLKGRYFLNSLTEGSVKRAFDQFELAIQKDPNYAPAWAGLARCYWLSNFMGMSMREAAPKAKEAALKAIALDDQRVEAHLSMASVLLTYDWDWAGAEREIRRALELNSNEPEAYYSLASYLAVMGRTSEAIEAQKRAVALDPLSVNANVFLGRLYYFARRYDEAIPQFQRAIQLNAGDRWSHFFLAITYEQIERYGDFAVELEKSMRISAAPAYQKLADEIPKAYARGGHNEVLRVWAETWEPQAARNVAQASSMAMIYGRMGQKERAMGWLEQAFRDRSRSLIYIKVEPQLDSLRSDPRFQEMLRRMGLPP